MERASVLQAARNGQFPEKFVKRWPEVHALVLSLTDPVPEHRFTASTVVEHLRDWASRSMARCVPPLQLGAR